MILADLHIHSKYSRATSKECVPEYLDLWARKKGLDLVGTGDFTHPAWREELKEKLEPAEDGLFALKEGYRIGDSPLLDETRPRFILSAEISSIYKQGDKVRKIHNVILMPGMEQAEALSRRLEQNFNLHSDGRPILGLPARDLLEITLHTCPEAIFIPAHIWTPHFSLFGAYSGFDDIRECFSDLTPHIHALETGLSSDPPMNWRLSALDSYVMVSNSDAHSPANLAREANLFDTELSYPAIARALQDPASGGFYGTIEFFPEEGKYHNDGHRNCKLCVAPEETVSMGGKCPVCGRRITVGVLHRVTDLADRPEGTRPKNARHFERIIPLREVVASSMGLASPASAKVMRQYDELLHALGPELFILREAPLSDIARVAGPCIAEGVRRLRAGEVRISPGYDGEYGRVRVLEKDEISLFTGQMSLFAPQEHKKLEQAHSVPRAAGAAAKQPEPAAVPAAQSEHYGLNAAQWEAASAAERAVAVLAGPGTGKTRTLIYRIAWLVEECGVPPGQITAVTFTNKAAAELRERLNAHFGNRKTVRAMHIGTFHGVCLGLLREWKRDLPILPQEEALSIVAEVLQARGLGLSPRDALLALSRLKNGQEAELPEGVYRDYQDRLSGLSVMDFDDILLAVLHEFDKNDAKSTRSRFRYLLVDEFQDSNSVQLRLLSAWGRDSESIFVIGDPDQAIYGFRGSDPRCFARFSQEFGPVRQIRLTENYRSTPQVLACALPVVGQKDALRAHREDGAPVRVLTAPDALSEGIFVAQEIERMVGGVDMLGAHAHAGRERTAVGFSDIALLVRTHRQAEVLEQCLSHDGIPYTVSGRDNLLEDPEVRAALSLFRFLLNPRDIAALRASLPAQDGDAANVLLAAYAPGPHSAVRAAELAEPAFSRFARMLTAYEPLVRRETPQALISRYLGELPKDAHPGLERLCRMAVLHKKTTDFLETLTLGMDGDLSRCGGKQYTPDAVSILTLHASKGLEFPVVFLCGVNEGVIPYESGRRKGDVQEERRLFYVGLTRAQEELVLVHSGPPSPFLAELPERGVRKASVALPKRPAGKQLGFF